MGNVPCQGERRVEEGEEVHVCLRGGGCWVMFWLLLVKVTGISSDQQK